MLVMRGSREGYSHDIPPFPAALASRDSRVAQQRLLAMTTLKLDPFHRLVAKLEAAALISSQKTGPTLKLMSVTVNVHGALETAMVCALGRESLRKEKDGTKRRTQEFGKLRDLCVEKGLIDLSPVQLDDLKALHENFRAEFDHVKPFDWHVPFDEMPRLATFALTAIEQLMREARWEDTDPDQEERFHNALETIRTNIRLSPP